MSQVTDGPYFISHIVCMISGVMRKIVDGGLPVPLLIRDLAGRADFSDVGVQPGSEERLRMRAMWYPFGSPVHHVPRDSSREAFIRLWTCETGVLRTSRRDEVLCVVAHVERLELGEGGSPVWYGSSLGDGWGPELQQALGRVRSRYDETGIFAELGALGEVSLRLYIPDKVIGTSTFSNWASGRAYWTALEIQLGELTGLWGADRDATPRAMPCSWRSRAV